MDIVCSTAGEALSVLPPGPAAALAPLFHVAKGARGVVVVTVTSNGIRTGLRIIGPVGRGMFVQSVDRTSAK